MKIILQSSYARARQRGSAVLIVLIVLALLALFVTENRRTVFSLSNELDRVEAEQIKRLNARGSDNDNDPA